VSAKDVLGFKIGEVVELMQRDGLLTSASTRRLVEGVNIDSMTALVAHVRSDPTFKAEEIELGAL
jgi:hypothetical protein